METHLIRRGPHYDCFPVFKTRARTPPPAAEARGRGSPLGTRPTATGSLSSTAGRQGALELSGGQSASADLTTILTRKAPVSPDGEAFQHVGTNQETRQ